MNKCYVSIAKVIDFNLGKLTIDDCRKFIPLETHPLLIDEANDLNLFFYISLTDYTTRRNENVFMCV